MTELIDKQVVGVGREGLFVALQRAVALDTLTGELHAQPHGHAVAGAFGKIGLDLNERTGASAHELADIAPLERFTRQLSLPGLHCEGVVYPILGDCHFGCLDEGENGSRQALPSCAFRHSRGRNHDGQI